MGFLFFANGNMVKDLNKGIDSIYYNHLNLPYIVDMDNPGDSIVYEYDAAGIKLQQRVHQADTLFKTTDYAGEFIYENGALQFIQHEEGRIIQEPNDSFTYQYHLKDHLGNVRTTFSTGEYTSGFLATFEDATYAQDTTDFFNIDPRVPYPVGGKAVRLNSTSPIGPGFATSVSRGDTISMSVKAYYEDISGHGTSPVAVANIASALTTAFGGMDGAGASEAQQAIYDIFNNDPAVTGALLSGNSHSDSYPSAYLNYLLFDTDNNFVDAGYFGVQEGANLEQTISVSDLVINQAGFIYIYLSNESNSSNYVFFDNLDIAISESPVLETTDYYPFGLAFGQGSGSILPAPEPTTEALVNEDFTSSHGFTVVQGSAYISSGKLRVNSNYVGIIQRTIPTVEGSSINLGFYFEKGVGWIKFYVNGVLHTTFSSSGQKQIALTGTGSNMIFRFETPSSFYSTYFYLDDFMVEETVFPEPSNVSSPYYKSGMLAQNFKYNGKEEINDLGLNWSDYGARFYDPALGRWHVVDPLADQFPSWTPYHFVHNNPINLIDPDGRAAMPPDDHYINNDGSIQTVKTDDNFDRFYVQDDVSETGYSLAGQLNKNDAGLVQFPASGTGFSRYGTSDAGGTSTSPAETVGQGDHYLQPETAAALFGLVNKLNTDFGFNISLGDMSSSNGSDPWQPGFKHHAGHGHLGKRSGLDVDFRYLNTDGSSFQSRNAFNSSSFSSLNNQRVYDAAATFGFTKNYQGTSGNLTGVPKVGDHNDHGHLGLQYRSLNWKFVPTAPTRSNNLFGR